MKCTFNYAKLLLYFTFLEKVGFLYNLFVEKSSIDFFKLNLLIPSTTLQIKYFKKMSAVDRFLQETLLRSKLSTSTSVPDPSKLRFSQRTTQATDTILPPYITYDQLHSFLLFHRLQHLNNLINSSTSKYSHSAQEELSTLHSQIMQLQPNRTASAASKFRTSTCYKQGSKWHEIFWIPADDFPTVNFVGLLIGPRGNTLKRMETDSGARISIRGRGAEKEGKVRSDGSVAGGMDEPLHCMVMGDSETAVRRAIDLIRQVVDKAASSPEAEAEMKQNQLRELAMLNGTLRD